MDVPPTVRKAAAFSALLLASVLGGCRDQPQNAAAPPEVSVVAARRTAVPVVTELPGRTSPYLVAQVRARVDGIVLQRLFQEGADVTAGQLLYQIDPAPYRAALDSARAQLARARANVESTRAQAERDSILVAANAVSKQTYINAVAAQRQAEADVAAGVAAVELASINLGYTDVTTPISGRIGPALVTQGAYVQLSEATLMATIQKIDPIYVDLNQTSVEGLQLRQDVADGRLKLAGPDQAKVHLVLENGGAYALSGTLEFTDITVDSGTGTVTVRAIFPNPQHLLLPGMFVRARIERGLDQHAILVPQTGVSHDRTGRATVLLVGPDNKVVSKVVTATRTLGSDWVVEDGLSEGDQVIVSGIQRAQPGTVVAPKLAQASTPVVQAHAN
ncbi:MAG TPA: efflux RND transporter periplasmic adaptor subunit [Povalibacter sp.]